MTLYKTIFIQGVVYLLTIVFLYAGFLKLMDLNTFYYQLGKSPLIPFGWNKVAGNFIVFFEFFLAVLFYYKRLKLFLILSLFLMMFFSIYISYLLYFSYFIPCSCGGILNELSWKSHLIFNCSLTCLGIAAYLIHHEN